MIPRSTVGRLLVVIVAALALAPTASAWTRVSTVGVNNTMQPAVLRTSSGAELAAYSDGRSALRVWSSAKGDVAVATGLLSVGKPALVQLHAGPIELYAPATTAGYALQGVLRWESSNDGATWSGPFATRSPNLGDVQAAAVRQDGTPMFSQDSTAGITVYQGLSGEVSHVVFSACCGYAESLAVDSSGGAQIAFWSNASVFRNLFVYQRLDGAGAAAGSARAFGQPQTAPRDDDVPLVADGAGNVFLGWAPGYPSARAFVVDTFRGGGLAHTSVAGGGSFAGGDPHMALGVDPANRLWAVWTQGGAVHARRSRSAGRHFGAVSAARLPGSAYQLAAIALADGRVDAFVNTGSAIFRQALLPALTVRASRTSATVLDDGAPVAGAVLRAAGRVARTGASGSASLAPFPRRARIAVSAAGYLNTAFTRP